jgi:3-methylcrotonyl-CoA carboxylase alpha subunit
MCAVGNSQWQRRTPCFFTTFSTGTKYLPLLDLARIWPTIIVGGKGKRVLLLTQALAIAAGLLVFAATPQGIDLRFADQRTLVNVCIKGELAQIHSAPGATQIIAIDLLAHAGEVHAEGGRLTAPMPGKVVSFAVQAGDVVKKGQPLAVLDAMKMEHTIAAPQDGVVTELLYAPGDQVVEGAELLRLTDAVM